MALSVTLTVSPRNRWLDRASPGKDNFLVSTVRLLSAAIAVATFVFGAFFESLNPIVVSITCWTLVVSSISRILPSLSRERSLCDVNCNLTKQILTMKIYFGFYYLVSRHKISHLKKVDFSSLFFISN